MNQGVKRIVGLASFAYDGLSDATAACTAGDAIVKGAKEIALISIATTGFAYDLKTTMLDIKKTHNS